MGTEDNLNDLRVASFSCYLKPLEAKGMGMVNIFESGGDKLSDMAVWDVHRLKPSILTAKTPSITSETSSWSNSQGMLLQRSMSQAKPSGRAFGSRFFHACAGPCATRKSVCVQQSINKGDQFAFPVLNPGTTAEKEEETVQELPRISLEVFGSGAINRGDIAKNLVRKMSILTWDAIPKSKESVICDDMGSEASSDLFEIENISKSEYHASESSFVMNQYAPSEASIEWSVVTASEAEFVSAREEKESVNDRRRTKTKKKKGNGLLGCRSVEVIQPQYRSNLKSKD